MKTAQRKKKKQAHAWIAKVWFFPAACESPKTGGLMFARREWERNDQAPSMSSVPKAVSRAAQLVQQWPDGTKRLKHVNLRHSQPIGQSGQAPSETKPREKGSRRSGVDQTSFGAMDLRWRIFGGSGAVLVTTVKDVEGWKIHQHGCMRLSKELLQMKPND